jgi:tetratricopeptide (TPR) repeat protein
MIGKTIAHYKIVEQLGEGGMGVVYKAEDTRLHRTVALKFLSSQTVATEADKQRLVDEARAAAALDHPNICTVHEINEFDGQSYLAMAYVEGKSLREEIDAGPLDVDRAVSLAVQIAKGLSAAHEKGIVHRDIKSANIMVTPKGDAKIMDFGIAHQTGAAVPDDDGTTAGTLAYGSPEQIRGDSSDHRTDIWSFGVTLYEMVTGKLPFRGDYPSAAAYAIQSETPNAIRRLRAEAPEALERIVGRALAKNPDDRYPSAEEMHDDLRALQIERDPTISKVLSGASGGGDLTPGLRQLVSGRVLASVGVYMVAVYAAVRLTDWLVSRFVWSPHLENIVAVALLAFLPTVVLLAMASSRGAGRGTSTARNVGVPLNVLAAVALVLAFFAGKDLGAATTTVAVTDEEGNTVERVVPKSEFRKTTAVFFFDNETGDSTLAWVHYAIPLMLQLDILQDPFVGFRSGFEPGAVNRLKRAGFDTWEGAPIALLQKIARELYTDYFLTGSYSIGDGGYEVQMMLHDTETGNLISERSVQDESLFELADKMTVTLKRDLGVPEGHIKTTKDLPIADVMTDSETALKAYVVGRAAYLLDNDTQAATVGAESAVTEDPTFAFAYLSLYVFYRLDNRADDATAALDNVMTYLYRLPERQQYYAKALYYDFKQDPDRQLAVLEMMVELYPDDIQSRSVLAGAYAYRNETDRAIEQLEKALEFDPYNFDLITGVVDLLVDRARFDEAVEILESYAEAQPDDPAALVKSGEVNETRGDLGAARRGYDRALLIDPSNVDVLVKLSNIEIKTGRFVEAKDHCEEALRVAKTAEDRFGVYDQLSDYYEIRGQTQRVLEATELMVAEGEQYLPPLQFQFVRLVTLKHYVDAGQPERAFALLDSVAPLIAPPLDKLAAIGDVEVYLALEQPDKAAEALQGVEEAVKAMQIRTLEDKVWQSKGDIAVLEGDYAAAIGSFTEELALDPTDTRIHRKIGKCQRFLGRYEEAKESIQKRLATHPMDPLAHYEMALAHADAGDMGAAMEHLKKALEVWEEADPDYEPAQKAREKLAEWNARTSM